MLTLTATDLPPGWTVGRSPIDPVSTQGLDLLAPYSGPPADWHETFMPDGTRAIFRISKGVTGASHEGEPEDYPPAVDAVLVAPGDGKTDDPFGIAVVDGKKLRAVPIEDIERALSARWAGGLIDHLRAVAGPAADRPLTRPDGRDPEVFSARVALRYLHHLAETPNPTHAIAVDVGVPHATAQRWVVAARKRGHLPPSTVSRGKR